MFDSRANSMLCCRISLNVEFSSLNVELMTYPVTCGMNWHELA